uniref:SWIM-type domain-containing protein n=1 Tax=Strongyloides papillosus TaxID=174720 RepID=A0A0N5BEQ3_STREA
MREPMLLDLWYTLEVNGEEILSLQEVNGEEILSLQDAVFIYPPYPRYPTCTKYYVQCDAKCSEDYNNFIKFIIDSFHESSCLCFDQKNDPIKNEIGINFYKHDGETDVALSYNERIPTNVSLNKNAFTDLKKAAFDVGLALGKQHLIKRKNLIFNFGAKEGTTAFRSLVYPLYEKMVEKKNVVYHNDKKRLSQMYCGDKCKERPPCKNGEYYDNFCFCTCPNGFKGSTCEELENNTCKHIGAKIHIAEKEKNTLALAELKGKCVFFIKSNNNNGNITIDINYIEFGGSRTPNKNSFIEIKYRNDKGTKGLTIYENVSNVELPSLSDKVYIITNDANGSFDLEIEYHLFNFGANEGTNAFRSLVYPYYEKMIKEKEKKIVVYHNDKRRLSEMYCGDKCEKSLPCKNGGYYDKYCLSCTCPFGFKGPTCEELENNTCKHIGAKIHIAEKEKNTLALAEPKGKCVFYIKSNNNNGKIIIDIKEIKFGGSNTPNKDRFIEIKYRDDKGTKGLTIYEDVSDVTLPSLSKEVYIITNDAEGKFDLDIEYHLNVTETGTLKS